MKISILGAGAMGSLFGGFLSEAGNEVWLVDIWREHVDTIRAKGLIIEDERKERVIRGLRAVTSPEEAGESELVLVFVKSTVTEGAVGGARPLFGKETLVLTLQNGLGNVERIASVIPASMILAGVTAQGATVLGPGRIYHAGAGLTSIGEISGPPTPRAKRVARLLADAGIRTQVSDNVMGLIWGKLLVNAGINALSALTGLRNGELLDHPETLELMESAVLEAARVAEARGIQLPQEDPAAHTKEVAKLTSHNRSSMLQDVLARRRTEIDALNGAIVREGEALGIKTPINKVLTNLVRMLEKAYLK